MAERWGLLYIVNGYRPKTVFGHGHVFLHQKLWRVGRGDVVELNRLVGGVASPAVGHSAVVPLLGEPAFLSKHFGRGAIKSRIGRRLVYNPRRTNIHIRPPAFPIGKQAAECVEVWARLLFCAHYLGFEYLHIFLWAVVAVGNHSLDFLHHIEPLCNFAKHGV